MWVSLKQWWRRRQSLGARGERAASALLRRAGYTILARNLRNRFGEIDLVIEDAHRRYLIIVEVKTTTAEDPPPETHVNYAKQRKLTGLASQLLRHKPALRNRLVRFDVVGIVWPADAAKPTRMTHHVNAFETTF